MFWALLAFLFLSVAFVKLGAMSVWLTVLSGALQAVLLLLGVGAGVALWRHLRNR